MRTTFNLNYILFYPNGSVIDDSRSQTQSEEDYIAEKTASGLVVKIYRRGSGVIVYEKEDS